ncbi:hypothetical protein LMIY3S_01999 [Labrys miyagiensis]
MGQLSVERFHGQGGRHVSVPVEVASRISSTEHFGSPYGSPSLSFGRGQFHGLNVSCLRSTLIDRRPSLKNPAPRLTARSWRAASPPRSQWQPWPHRSPRRRCLPSRRWPAASKPRSLCGARHASRPTPQALGRLGSLQRQLRLEIRAVALPRRLHSRTQSIKVGSSLTPCPENRHHLSRSSRNDFNVRRRCSLHEVSCKPRGNAAPSDDNTITRACDRKARGRIGVY